MQTKKKPESFQRLNHNGTLNEMLVIFMLKDCWALLHVCLLYECLFVHFFFNYYYFYCCV